MLIRWWNLVLDLENLLEDSNMDIFMIERSCFALCR